jgi:hypothetical protein
LSISFKICKSVIVLDNSKSNILREAAKWLLAKIKHEFIISFLDFCSFFVIQHYDNKNAYFL